MKKLNRKGFTIVELVIVIAVIAILAAVLIPTMSNLIKTAQTSADVTLVKNVNLILATERATEGKNATMQEALNDAFDGGYDITKLSPTNSDNLILWDQESDNFVLYANGKYNNAGADVDVENLVDYQLWNISETTDGAIHSIYYIGNETEVTVDGVGFDAGTSSVETVNYKNTTGTPKDVLIRTNGGALNVNAATDTVNHYGEVHEVYIEEIADASYHEFGKVTFIKVQKGRVEVETSATIGGIYVTSDNARVTNESGAKLPTVNNADEIGEAEAKEAAANAVPPAGVARIGLTGYETLQAAVDAAEAGAKVILTKDVNMGTLWVSGGKDLTLDFNGHNIKIEKAGDYGIIISGSNLTIDGEGELVSGSHAVYCYNGGNVTINGGSYKGSNAVHINGGNATINDGTFEEAHGEEIVYVDNDSNVVINGGTFNTNSAFTSQRILSAWNSSMIHIAGGTFNAHYEDTEYNGDIYVGSCQDVDSFVISGGVFNCTISTNYKMKVTGGEFNGQIAISPNSTGTEEEPTLLVTGGTFNVEKAPFVNKKGNKLFGIVIEGGLFKANTAASNSGKVLWETFNKNCRIYPHGGTYMMNPAESTTNGLGLIWETNTITDNYDVVDNGNGTWTVVKK